MKNSNDNNTCHTNYEKWKTTNDERNTNTKSRKNIRKLGEKETYEYLGILEADTITQAEMNEKILKRKKKSQENEKKYLKPNYIEKNLWNR